MARKFPALIVFLFMQPFTAVADIWLEDIVIPPQIQQIATMTELKLYLETDFSNFPAESRLFWRLCAIDRIGVMNEPEAFDVLKSEYLQHADEAGTPNPESLPYYRKHIIDAMARIDTPQSREFIFSEFNTLLNAGPRLDRKRYVWQDAYYTVMVTNILRIMGSWEDRESGEILEKVCTDPEYSYIIREAAYRGKFMRDIKPLGDLNKKVDYLLSTLTGPGEGSKEDFTSDGKTTESTRNSGIMQVLIGLGPQIVPCLAAKKAAYEKEGNAIKVKCVDWALRGIEGRQRKREFAVQKWDRLK